MSGNFKATRWWRIIDSNGELWCETSSQQEAEDSVRPGDTLQRLYERTEQRWMDW